MDADSEAVDDGFDLLDEAKFEVLTETKELMNLARDVLYKRLKRVAQLSVDKRAEIDSWVKDEKSNHTVVNNSILSNLVAKEEKEQYEDIEANFQKLTQGIKASFPKGRPGQTTGNIYDLYKQATMTKTSYDKVRMASCSVFINSC